MLLAYARAMVSNCDVVVNRTGVPCLYLKNDVAYSLSIHRDHKNANTCNDALEIIIKTS